MALDLVEKVKSAGVVGAGGAGFPTHVKLAAQAEYFIVNAAECEPLIETDKYLCRAYAERIVSATEAVALHLGASRAVIALKAKYEDEIGALKAAAAKAGEGIEICAMPSFYPAGDEQTMVQFVTGSSVPERGLPLNVGAVVDNVGTMLGIADALEDLPVTDKFLSVTGEVKAPVMLRVPIGTSVVDCIANAELTTDGYAVVVGGPMMGKLLADDGEIEAAVVGKTTGNILVLSKEHYLVKRGAVPFERIRHQSRSACIQCRMCTDMCPRYLIGHEIRPHLVMRNLWRENSIASDEEYIRCFGDALNCCDCGVCEMFACPMGLSPRRVNVYFKQRLREKGLDKERNMAPRARPSLKYRRVPTERLIARLGMLKYYGAHVHGAHIEFVPAKVYIPFSQHIGRPALSKVKEGDAVTRGSLIAEAQGAVSANVHASVSGTVEKSDARGALIRVAGGGDGE